MALVFTTIEQDCIDAVADIRSYPRTGTVKSTGLPEVGGQPSLRWDFPKQRATDGKWWIKTPPEDLGAQFYIDHPCTEEPYSEDWQ